MPRVDQEFAATIARALEIAGWGVCEASRRAGITERILSDARAGNCILSNRNVRALIIAMLDEGHTEAALMLAGPFLPDGALIYYRGASNDLSTWSDEIAATFALLGVTVSALEDGAVTRRELEEIRRSQHLATGMWLDQIEAVELRIKAQQRPPRIAGAALQRTG